MTYRSYIWEKKVNQEKYTCWIEKRKWCATFCLHLTKNTNEVGARTHLLQCETVLDTLRRPQVQDREAEIDSLLQSEILRTQRVEEYAVNSDNTHHILN